MSVFAEMHDGTRLEFPDGTDPAVIQRVVKKRLGVGDEPVKEPGAWDRVKAQTEGVGKELQNLTLGAVRGAGSIGNTIVSGAEMIQRARGLPTGGRSYDDRKQGMDEALRTVGADINSPSFATGKLATEAAGTAQVGGILAAPVRVASRVIPALAPVASAIGSAGMTTGRTVAPGLMAGAGDLALRAAGGAVTGAGMTAAVGQDATTGAVIGAALPPALKVAGAAGSVLAKGWQAIAQPRAVNAAEDLAKALGVATPEQRAVLVEQLRSAPELITHPTVAQALQSPEAGILQRVVHDAPGGGALRKKIAEQAAARTAALEGVAPVAPNGLGQAREDLGRRVANTLIPEREAAVQRGRALYEAVDDPANPVRLQLPIDEMQAVADKYLGPGVVGQGDATRRILSAGNELGTTTTNPLITNMRQAASTELTLGAAVRRLGISPDELKAGMSGEVRYLKESKFGKGLVNKNGRSLDDLAERMHADGYLESPDAHELLQKLTDEAAGSPVMSRFGDPTRMARDAGMPDKRITPGASNPLALDWKTLQDFRSSVGKEAFKSKLAMNDRDAAALGEIKGLISGRVDQAAGQGLLKEGENFPADAYARWVEANAAHAERKGRFDNGPLGGIFRVGKDGEPVLQGADIAKRAWGDVSDVKAFKKLVGDHEDLLGEFRSMVTTEAAETAPASGELGAKFVRWVDKKLPALKEAFSEAEVQRLQTIAADIERANKANAAGKTLAGSDTYQKAANALSLGVLDSPGLSLAAGRIPYIGRPALDFVRGKLGASKAERLAELLADAPTAANALARVPRGLELDRLNRLVAPSVYRGAPRSSRDR